jgi:hypothetical protein
MVSSICAGQNLHLGKVSPPPAVDKRPQISVFNVACAATTPIVKIFGAASCTSAAVFGFAISTRTPLGRIKLIVPAW